MRGTRSTRIRKIAYLLVENAYKFYIPDFSNNLFQFHFAGTPTEPETEISSKQM